MAANWPNSRTPCCWDEAEAEAEAAGLAGAALDASATCLTRLGGVKGWGPVCWGASTWIIYWYKLHFDIIYPKIPFQRFTLGPKNLIKGLWTARKVVEGCISNNY